MSRPLTLKAPRYCVALGVLAAAAVAASAAPGAAAVSGDTAAGKLRMIISERGDVVPPAGTFVLEGAAGSDSGTSKITPGAGPARIRDGQRIQTVSGNSFLHGKKGDLVIGFSGISVDVSRTVSVEYGTWRVLPGFGTGRYTDWRGGGRWAATSTIRNGSTRYIVRWEGLVTR